MKVLHVAPSIAQSYGGPTHSLAGYAVASRLAGIDVSIAAPQCSPQDVEFFRSRAGDSHLKLFRGFGQGAFAASPALIRWVHRCAASYDVVHVHGLFNPTSSLSARTAIRSRTPTVIRPFGTLSRYTFQHRRTAMKRVYLALLERKNVTEAAALHFTTDRERDEANWHGIDLSGRGYVIPPPSLAAPTAPRPNAVMEDGIRVLFLGRINPIKNLECLLDAWPSVQAARPDALLELAGDGDPGYVAALQQRASRLGLANSVSFTGFLAGPAKQRTLSSASLVVLPSHHENFGVVILEAIEAGAPVVVSTEVHLANFVQREQVGRVVESTPTQLADAILSVISDEQMRCHVRTRGASLVAANFSPSAIAELLSDMYRAVIERSGASARV